MRNEIGMVEYNALWKVLQELDVNVTCINDLNDDEPLKFYVNWSCMGAVEPEEAEEYAKKIEESSKIAKLLNHYEFYIIWEDVKGDNKEDNRKRRNWLVEKGRDYIINYREHFDFFLGDLAIMYEERTGKRDKRVTPLMEQVEYKRMQESIGGKDMSAYVVNNETITAIATAFVEYGVGYHDGEVHETQLLYSKNGMIKDIGQSLLQTNYDAVNYRYRENTKCPDFKPVDGLEINEGIVYGCIRCYNYQACELEDWEVSEVKKSLNLLEEMLLKRLIKKAGQKCEWGYDGVNLFD